MIYRASAQQKDIWASAQQKDISSPTDIRQSPNPTTYQTDHHSVRLLVSARLIQPANSVFLSQKTNTSTNQRTGCMTQLGKEESGLDLICTELALDETNWIAEQTYIKQNIYVYWTDT